MKGQDWFVMEGGDWKKVVEDREDKVWGSRDFP